MIVNDNGLIIHMDSETAESYGNTLVDDYNPTAKEIQIDPDLGLELVEKETILSKYGIQLDPTTNAFHRSLTDFMEARGFLTPKQLSAIRK